MTLEGKELDELCNKFLELYRPLHNSMQLIALSSCEGLLGLCSNTAWPEPLLLTYTKYGFRRLRQKTKGAACLSLMGVTVLCP